MNKILFALSVASFYCSSVADVMTWDTGKWSNHQWGYAANDYDGDGISNISDNCFLISNPAQLDVDGDLLGNECDVDDDGDGIADVDEINWGLDPLLADYDADGVNDQRDEFPTDPEKQVKDNSYWNSIGGIQDVNGTIETIVRIGDDIYVGGSFTSIGGVSANRVARWDGVTWNALGNGINGTVYSIAQDINGNLCAAGLFTSAGGTPANNIAAWDGVEWSAMGAGTNATVRAMAMDAYGDLYVGGAFTLAGDLPAYRLARWDGYHWNIVGSQGLSGTVYSLVSYGSGLYVGGSFTSADGAAVNKIVKWNDGWEALGTGMGGSLPTVLSLALDSQGNLYAGGAFTTAGGVIVNRIAKWNGSTWSGFGSGMNGNVAALTIGSNGMLFAGGAFSSADGTPVNKLATWSGSHWLALGSGVDNAVTSFGSDSAGNLLVAGSFAVAGGQPAGRIAQWLLLDSDRDGYLDHLDLFPDNIREWVDGDIDGDGMVNSVDHDDDGDGTPDVIDLDRLNPSINETDMPLDGVYKGSTIQDDAGVLIRVQN